MLLADTMAWVFAILGMLLALPGLWLLCRGLWPRLVERTTDDCTRGLWKQVLVGIPIVGGTVFLVSVSSKLPSPWQGIFPILIVSSAVLFASIGIAGLATVVGHRLPSPTDAERPWQATIRGAIVLELAFLVPFVGWFLLLPLSLMLGAGSTLRAILKEIWSRPKPDKPSSHGSKSEPSDRITQMPTDIQFDGTLGAPT